ncbi:MAG: ATP-dependent helicase [Lachnospiraceae bacterium]|nr:ATP-dependent helicase [Lachnospiraceae bacterium]
MKLNETQAAAALHHEGPALVLAGPGTGKTAVITARVSALTEKYGVPPSEILVITFTRAAALEMESRYREQAEGRGVTFGTFHSIFFRILRERYHYEAGDILREGARLRLLSEIVTRLYPNVPCEQGFLQELLSEISLVKNNGTDLAKYKSKNGRVHFQTVLARYDEAVRRSRKLDFDDMLVLTKRLLQTEPDVLREYQDKFRFIMVDEFQDINRLQYDVVRMLAEPERNLFIVGDDDQSIYEFRGAAPEIMLSFPKDYPGTKIFRLMRNYRSVPEIVRVSGNLIRHNRERYEKKLEPEKKASGKILYERVKTDKEESSAVLQAIREAVKAGVPYDDIAVLFRTNSGTTGILGAMTAAGIPFYTRDQIPNVYRHFSVKPLFGILNFAAGHTTRKNFLQFMNCPVRYFRREELTSENVDLKALKSMYARDPVRSFMVEKTEELERELSLLGRMKTPYAKINYFRIGMGYDEYLRETSGEKGLPADELLGILNEVQDSAREFTTLDEWYEFIAAYTRKLEDQENRGGMMKDRVTVATYHASKGLEYHTVLLPDVNERVIPHEKALAEGKLEEERRLFYVAVTRAEKELRLYSVDERYGKKTEISRFLKELKI